MRRSNRQAKAKRSTSSNAIGSPARKRGRFDPKQARNWVEESDDSEVESVAMRDARKDKSGDDDEDESEDESKREDKSGDDDEDESGDESKREDEAGDDDDEEDKDESEDEADEKKKRKKLMKEPAWTEFRKGSNEDQVKRCRAVCKLAFTAHLRKIQCPC
jgi:hypothetical protein